MIIRAPILTRPLFRQYSTTPSNHPFLTGLVHLSNRALLSLHGPDAPKFLQGLVTNSVPSLSPTDSLPRPFYAAFLSAPGKVLHDVFIYPLRGEDGEPQFFIEVHAAGIGQLTKHLRKHKLRSKFSIRTVDKEELCVWSAWGSNRPRIPGPREDTKIEHFDTRSPSFGHRILSPFIPDASDPLDNYTAHRYFHGIPEGQAEIPHDEALPMNNNMDLMGGIDFTKGCYLGQELTIRTHHTGVVRRRVLPLRFHGDEKTLEGVQAGMDIKKDDARGRVSGKVLGRVGDLGLGLVRLEVMTDLPVSAEGSKWREEDKFMVETEGGGKVGVEAVVGPWMRTNIATPRKDRRVG